MNIDDIVYAPIEPANDICYRVPKSVSGLEFDITKTSVEAKPHHLTYRWTLRNVDEISALAGWTVEDDETETFHGEDYAQMVTDLAIELISKPEKIDWARFVSDLERIASFRDVTQTAAALQQIDATLEDFDCGADAPVYFD